MSEEIKDTIAKMVNGRFGLTLEQAKQKYCEWTSEHNFLTNQEKQEIYDEVNSIKEI